VIPTADRTKATVMVKVTILDKDPDLKPEMSAKATFIEPDTAADPNAPVTSTILVPQAAVVTRNGKPHVFEVVDGVAKLVAVTTGVRRQDRVVVTGLVGGETLVMNPPDGLKDGDRVSPRR
jgi:hypothetical protein